MEGDSRADGRTAEWRLTLDVIVTIVLLISCLHSWFGSSSGVPSQQQLRLCVSQPQLRRFERRALVAMEPGLVRPVASPQRAAPYPPRADGGSDPANGRPASRVVRGAAATAAAAATANIAVRAASSGRTSRWARTIGRRHDGREPGPAAATASTSSAPNSTRSSGATARHLRLQRAQPWQQHLGELSHRT